MSRCDRETGAPHGRGWTRRRLLAAAAAGLAAPAARRAAGGEADPSPANAPGTLRAGAAAVKITPALDRPVYLAGYENNRRADSVHDDLWARALVLDSGGTRLAVVACDLIGLTNRRVRRIRERIRAVSGERILVAATHVHSGPDTLGMWGPNLVTTGLDPAYMERLETEVAAAVERAAAALRPVRLLAGTGAVPEELVHNRREPIQDPTLTALRFVDPSGATVATVAHYGAHPEVNRSRAITSDFVHFVREAMERRFGGVALYLNGALGGMVTPKVRANTLEEARRVGDGIGAAAVAALERAAERTGTPLRMRQKRVRLPVENPRFALAAAAGLLDSELRDGATETEVCRLDLGEIVGIGVPGEVLPKPALALKAAMPGPCPMVVALANDELGYLLDPEDFDRPLYRYERGMSAGRRSWPLLLEAARELLAAR